MRKLIPASIACLALLSTCAIADAQLKTQKQKASYIIGVQLGKQLIVNKDHIDPAAMKLGLEDMFSGTKPRLSNEEMQKVMMKYQEDSKKSEEAMMKKFSKHNKKEGDAYLAKNKKKKGVVTLASGLQYKVLKSGKGKVHPKATDTVETNYHGTLIDGTVFDSSYDRGQSVTFPVNGVIKGWSEALQKMKVGDKWQLVIPPELAYGERGVPPSIGPNSTLVFDVELLSIKK